jgi:hypothetical protein
MRLPVFPMIFLLLFSLIILAVMPMLVPLAPQRAILQKLIGEKIGFATVIKGEVHLRFLPRPQVFLHDIDVIGAAQGQLDSQLDSQSEGHVVRALKSAHIDRAVIDLSWRGMADFKISIGRLTIQDAKIHLEINNHSAGFIGRFVDAELPPIDIVRGHLSLAGLSSVNPTRRWELKRFDAQLGRDALGIGRRFSLQHRPLDGPTTRLSVVLGSSQPRTTITIRAQSDDGDGLEFNGFIRGEENWQAVGEVNLKSSANLANLLANGLGLQIASSGRNTELSGLLRMNSANIVSDDLQVQALGAAFRTRLSLFWANENQQTPHIEARLSTGFIDLTQVSALDTDVPQQDVLEFLAIGSDILDGATGRLRVEANRFAFADENGRDLLLSVSHLKDRLRFERISADLPFNSSLLGAGDVVYAEQGPAFNGSFSARSSDTLGMLIWLGKITNQDFSLFIENVDESRVQRLSFVTDVDWSNEKFALSGLAGRLGDDRIDLDLTLPNKAEMPSTINLRMRRLDLADWGLASAGNNDLRATSLLPNLDIGKAFALSGMDTKSSNFDVSLQVDRLYADVRDMGPLTFLGSSREGALYIKKMLLSDYEGAEINIEGKLEHDGQTHGDIKLSLATDLAEPLLATVMTRLSPFNVNVEAPLKLQATWGLSSRAAANWPNVRLMAGGRLGDVDLSLDVTSPDRGLDFNVAGSKVKLALSGQANDLAARLNMPQQFSDDARGTLRVDTEAQPGVVMSLNGNLNLQDDEFALTATIRPDSTGRRLEGLLQARGADILPFISDTRQGTTALAFDGKTQVSVTKDAIGFSSLNMAWDDGTISGQGLYSVADGKKLLRANLLLDGFDGTSFLPQFSAENGWSQEPMQWFLLGQSNADLDLRLRNAKFGRVPIETAEARLKVRDGVLEAPEIEIAALGGEVSVSLQAEGGNLTPLFNLSARFTDLDLAAFFTALYGQPFVDAEARGTFEARGRGRSAMEMIASLSGAANVETNDGQLSFLALPAMEDLTNRATPALARDFERSLGVFFLRDGIFETGAAEIVFAPPQEEGKLSTRLDLMSRQLDFMFDFASERRSQMLEFSLQGDVATPELLIEKPEPFPPQEVGQLPAVSATN